MIDLNHTATKRAAFSRTITDSIDAVVSVATRLAALEAIDADLTANPPQREERPGRSVSASAVGDECARRIQLGIWPTFHPDKPAPRQAPIDDKLAAIFERGHRTETLMAEWLKAAGFYLLTHTRDPDTGEERQFGFVTAGGQIKGFADGLISEREPSLTLPSPLQLWETKTVNAKNWRAVSKHGVLKQYPKYDAQAQLLMAYLDMPATLFTFLNAETGEIYAELLPFNVTRAQAISDRAVHILQATRAGDLLPKAGSSGDVFPCKWCRFVGECWP